jgi:superfamily I DNA and/or RNA helicase
VFQEKEEDSVVNRHEARTCAVIAQRLVDGRSKIAVITFYRAQVRELQKQMTTVKGDVRINTVDAFQVCFLIFL